SSRARSISGKRRSRYPGWSTRPARAMRTRPASCTVLRTARHSMPAPGSRPSAPPPSSSRSAPASRKGASRPDRARALAASVPAFEPYTEAFAADPYPVYAALRETTPVFRSEALGMVLVTRYRDVRRLLTDRRFGRTSVPRADGRPPPGPLPGELPHWDRWVRVNLLETEGETHARLRRLLGGALAPARIQALAGSIEAIATALMQRLEPGSEVDFVSEIAEPLPVSVIAELFGWPPDEIGTLRPWAADIVRLYEKDATAEDRRRADEAARAFGERLIALIEERRRRPQIGRASCRERGQVTVRGAQ